MGENACNYNVFGILRDNGDKKAKEIRKIAEQLYLLTTDQIQNTAHDT